MRKVLLTISAVCLCTFTVHACAAPPDGPAAEGAGAALTEASTEALLFQIFGELATESCPSGPPAEPLSGGPCLDCDSYQGYCVHGDNRCRNYCLLLVGEVGMCSLDCDCCVCPEVWVQCAWACVCAGIPTSDPTSECPSQCSVQWYCP